MPHITGKKGIITNISRAIYSSVSSATKGVENSIAEISRAITKLGKSVHLVSKHATTGVSKTTRNITGNLGRIIKRVPIAGRPAVYLIKGAQKGVYHIMLTTANLVGFGARTVGRTSRKAGKIIIFTLTTTKNLGKNILKDTNRVIKKILKPLHRRRRTRRKRTRRRSK